MEDIFYSVIKLVTGEEIFCMVSADDNSGDPVILVQNPVIMKIINGPSGTYVKVKPWLDIPNDDMFVIKMDKIVTMTEVKDSKMIHFYHTYLNDNEEVNFTSELSNNGKSKITNKMGYISSVEDARKKLENLFNNNKES